MAGSTLVDQFGQPVSFSRFLDASNQSNKRPAWPTRAEGILRAVNTFDLRTAVYASRRLYANMGIPKGAIDQKAMFAVGRAWHPIYRGRNSEWGDKAVDWLINEWYPVCEVRGGAFDFVTSLEVDSITIDRDGGYGILLTETTDGYPLTQRIPIHRFGDRYENRLRQVEDGPYRGLNIYQGIIFNPRGRPIAYRIYEDPVNYDTPSSSYVDISANDLIHVYDPEWYDQGHGFPAFTHALNDLRDMQQSQQWEQLAMLIASSIGLIETNETGTEDENDPLLTLGNSNPDPNSGLRTQTLDGGMVRYFKAGTGSKLEAFVNDRPGDIWDQFNDRLARAALLGINWPYSLVWKPEGGGTDTRADILRARVAVESRQDLLRPPARRVIGYAISKAIKLGKLDPDPDWYRWDFSMPPKMGIDDGRFAQQRRADLVAGVETLERDALDRGTTWVATRNQREREVVDLLTRADRIAKQFDISVDAALTLLQQQNANQQISISTGGDSSTTNKPQNQSNDDEQ